MKPVRVTPRVPEAGPHVKEPRGVTLRAIVIGLILTALIDMWVHYAELLLGGERGHTALVNTSIPVGPFNALFALVMLNILLGRLSPSLKLAPGEMLTIYVMTAVSTVLSSSGGIHFLVPTITAAHYFANQSNGWAGLLFSHIPNWLVQSDPEALKGFYQGGAQLDLGKWALQIGVWTGFLLIFSTATLCLTLILRKQWIEREHLPFPTVMLPLELAKEGTPILRDPLFWAGTVATFALVWWNTLALNYPSIPSLSLRPIDITNVFTSPPWNAMGQTRMAFFPFAIGIGYLLSTEVVFSVWFFYLFNKLQLVAAVFFGLHDAAASGLQAGFPYLTYQGAGAFLGLAAASIYVSRYHLRDVIRATFDFSRKLEPEEREYRIAVFGLAACVLAMVLFAVAAGASVPVAAAFVALVLIYLMAATRLRAETGNAWPVGPEVDAFRLMTTIGGTAAYNTSDLTALTYMRMATAGQDFRGVCMPHQLDGLKIADEAKIKPGKLAVAMIVAVAFGVVASMIIGLRVWTHYGALAELDAWRNLSGQRAFSQLAGWLKAPQAPDGGGMLGIAIGFAFTMLLAYMRMLYTWWPFHPAGYCMSNTFTSYNVWMPCFIAWLAKVLIIRLGGMKMYRRALPLFLGLIAGDFLGGGTTTLLGCFTFINVYPVNW